MQRACIQWGGAAAAAVFGLLVAAPLKAADDAVLIDSSSMPLSEVVHQLEETVRAALRKR